jgi:hypothetical protein
MLVAAIVIRLVNQIIGVAGVRHFRGKSVQRVFVAETHSRQQK